MAASLLGLSDLWIGTGAGVGLALVALLSLKLWRENREMRRLMDEQDPCAIPGSWLRRKRWGESGGAGGAPRTAGLPGGVRPPPRPEELTGLLRETSPPPQRVDVKGSTARHGRGPIRDPTKGPPFSPQVGARAGRFPIGTERLVVCSRAAYVERRGWSRFQLHALHALGLQARVGNASGRELEAVSEPRAPSSLSPCRRGQG
jgi:hypothetical protein